MCHKTWLTTGFWFFFSLLLPTTIPTRLCWFKQTKMIFKHCHGLDQILQILLSWVYNSLYVIVYVAPGEIPIVMAITTYCDNNGIATEIKSRSWSNSNWAKEVVMLIPNLDFKDFNSLSRKNLEKKTCQVRVSNPRLFNQTSTLYHYSIEPLFSKVKSVVLVVSGILDFPNYLFYSFLFLVLTRLVV